MSADITIRDLVKSFGGSPVLRGIDLTIEDGEFFTLLGPSGCGKTTMLRCISGFERADSGQILIGDEDVTKVDVWKRNIGFVFQNYALWPHMTVADNVAFGLKTRKVGKDERAQRVADALAMIDMSHVANRYPGELSGGQQQRVAIARALVFRPRVLLFDEPLSNLDAQLRVKMRREIKDIQRSLNITSIYVTHDQEEALELSDRIAVMSGGEVLQVDTPAGVYRDPHNETVARFVGRNNRMTGVVENGIFNTADRDLRLDAAGREDGPAVLCFRPEDVRVSERATAGSHRATIVSSGFRGSYSLGELQLPGGKTFLADLPPLAASGHVTDFTVARYHLFDAKDAA
ncbi:ABC transporter ATP-binding protein [Microbacterium rhizosphaerae]|uniref:ABC transporter ATP-binding protein n=1 Tax=Microbacterium rhizosphaerae TaxID=1678237 RepID=A0ABZ0SN15_9MICO|nr:ABC transporter ATP-binding protein [Microbacterium rhizosphaerae]WPR89661.1 ABC transporter ATP-binding protein [Microbacterium rhizosphaerae]